MKSKELVWFESKNCESLEIKSYATLDDANPKVKAVTDKTKIAEMMALIGSLPVEGEMMISFSMSASLLALEFSCGPRKTTIEFYDGRIKTPGTSFYTRKKVEAESHVFEMAQSFLK